MMFRQALELSRMEEDPEYAELLECMYSGPIDKSLPQIPCHVEPCHDPDGALQKAVREGKEDLLGDLLKHCTENQINSLDEDGLAALHYAVESGSIIMIKKLLKAKCDRRVCTKDGLNPVHIAAHYPPQGIGTGMVTGVPTHAVSTSHQVIQVLLEYGGNSVDEQIKMLTDHSENVHKWRPLHMACSTGNESAVQELLKHIQRIQLNDCVNYQDKLGNTPLNMACSIGNLPIVKELLKHGADTNAINVLRMSPLQTACSRGYVSIVKAILEYNHESASKLVEACFTRSNTVMHCVADSGDLEMMQVLLGYGAIHSAQNDDGVAPIHYAAGKGHVNIATKLLECDASGMDLLDKQLRSPLHYAASSDQVGMIELLLSKGCNKECLDKDSVSPLLLSVKFGKLNALRTLMDAKCSIDTRDKDGKTTVFWATQMGYNVLMVILEDQSAKLLIHVPERRHLNTPFHIAAEMGCVEVIKLLATQLDQLSEEMCTDEKTLDESTSTAIGRWQAPQQERDQLEVLKKKVHHLDFRNDKHKTPLHLAAMSGKLEAVRFLVQKYPHSLICVDINGRTPLHLAAKYGRTNVAGFLIRQGAVMDMRMHDWTPLHVAAVGGHAKIISLLIGAGAEREAKGRDGMTPLHLAAERGHAEIISLLIDAGAKLEAKDIYDRTALYWACTRGYEAAAKVLMEKGAKVEAQNTDQLNCLDIAVERGHENIALAIIHTCQWKRDFINRDGQMTPFKKMIRQMPSAAEAVLDHCIELKDKETLQVQVCYSFLDDYSAELKSTKDHPLALMVKHERIELLKHPVVSSLLEYKWWRFGLIPFAINLTTYLIFLLFLTMYALILPHPDEEFCISQSVASLPVNGTVRPFETVDANRSNALKIDPSVPMSKHANMALYLAAIIVIITAVARLLVVECFQFVRTPYRYFLSTENYIEVLAYVSSVIFVSQFGTNCWCSTNWQWQLGAIAVFLAWINLILFLKRVPHLDIYILIFNSILQSFLKFALIAFLFVVAFCIAFYMILYKAVDDATMVANVSPFRNVGLSFIKTMVMATGELGYDNIFGHNNESRSLLSPFPVVAYILWIIFLIVMPILLLNLLVGLAVGDTKVIRDQIEFQRLSLKIHHILAAEKLLSVFNCPKCSKRTVKIPHGKFRNKVLKLLKVYDWLTQENIKKRVDKVSEAEKTVEDQRKSVYLSGEMKLRTEVSRSAPVPDQTGDLSKKVQQLQTEMNKLIEKNNRIMEKNNNMEELLQLMAQRLGIRAEEAGRLDEGEDKWSPAFED